mgnify:CR=1 FL=1
MGVADSSFQSVSLGEAGVSAHVPSGEARLRSRAPELASSSGTII